MKLYRIVPTKRGAARAWGVECAGPGVRPGIIQEFREFADAERALDTLRSIELTNVLRECRNERMPGPRRAVV